MQNGEVLQVPNTCRSQEFWSGLIAVFEVSSFFESLSRRCGDFRGTRNKLVVPATIQVAMAEVCCRSLADPRPGIDDEIQRYLLNR